VSLTQGSTTREYVFYPQSGAVLNVLELETATISSGKAFTQQEGPFTSSVLKGNYALLLTGRNLSTDPGREVVTGQANPNGGSAVSGTVDLYVNGTVVRGTAIQSGSTYGVSSNGRGTASLRTGAAAFPSAAYFLYVTGPGKALLLESDGGHWLAGSVEKQEW
jgi:hypothetical protein